MSKANISAFIVCCNEERNIRRCLESIKWCDEIVVVDSGSKDKTLEICKEYSCRILQRDWSGYVEQKRFGLEQCTSEWVLNLDADEEVSDNLRNEILELLASDPNTNSKINGYYLSRVVFYLGRWWRHGGWYPEYRLRLCRKSHTTWGGKDPHEKAIVDGETRKLTGELHHYTYNDITDQITRLNKYASTAALSMFQDGRHSSFVNVIFNPLSRFIKFYLIKKGFLEGLAGLIVACLESYYVFLKYIKLWELERNQIKEKVKI